LNIVLREGCIVIDRKVYKGFSAASGIATALIITGVVFATFGFSGSAAADAEAAITAADFGEPQTWGATKNVVKVKHMYISGQPDNATLIEAREQGVAAVINVRGPKEIDWDEEAATVALGLDYYNIPIVSGDHGFDANAIDEITRLVGQYKDQKVLIHCASGNRVSGWLAVHLVRDHDMQVDPAIELAKLANLTSPAIATRVRESLDE
jgi:protein tyrosine phosphatase (PTP) superfamily phosphohydrolase (DUF442 family)